MALLFMDGCDSGDNKIFRRSQNSGGPFYEYKSTSGIYGGGAHFAPWITTLFDTRFDSHPFGITWPDPHPYSTLRGTYVSFWCKVIGSFPPSGYSESNIPSGSIFLQFMDYNRNFISIGNLLRSQYLSVDRQLSSAGLGTEGAVFYNSNMADGNWHNLKVYIKCDNSSGNLKISIDDKIVCDISGIDNIGTITGSHYGFRLINFGSAYANYSSTSGILFDDIIVWDDNDIGDGFSDWNIDFQKIHTLRVNADTAQNDSIPFTGSDSYAMIDESGLSSNDYVFLENAGQDIYDIENINYSGNVNMVTATLIQGSNIDSSLANTRIFLSTNNYTLSSNSYYNSGRFMSTNLLPSANFAMSLISGKDFGNNNISWSNTTIDSLQIGIENVGLGP